MILSLELVCFRQHVEASFVFKDGLNTLRGRNEDGKTSILLGILYALWGAKALPAPLEETVTWGYPVKDLKARLTMSINGHLYLFTRSKAGAECSHSGGMVTGQTEVSKFASELLGADSSRASKLMVASQSDLRGALVDGSTSLSAYIEDLSGMDLFDTLLEEASIQLTTGPTTVLDTAIERMQEVVDQQPPQVPDHSTVDKDIDKISTKLEDLKETLETVIEPSCTMAHEAYTMAVAVNETREAAVKALASVEHSLLQHKKELEDACDASEVEVDEDRLAKVTQLLHDVTIQKEARKAYEAFEKLVYPTATWTGDHASLMAEIAQTTANKRVCSDRISDLKVEIATAEAKRVQSAECSYCGKDFSELPEVAKKNADLDEAIECLKKRLALEKARLDRADCDLADLEAIRKAEHKVLGFYSDYSDYVIKEEGQVPPVLRWNFNLEDIDIDIDALTEEKTALSKALKAKKEALTLIPHLSNRVDDEQHRVHEMFSNLPPSANTSKLKEEWEERKFVAQVTREEIASLKDQLRDMELRKESDLKEYETKLAAYEEAKVYLDKLKEERRVLVRNNALVKKIKAARPIVAAKLWTVVLSSVSVMFSNMREEKSIVGRNSDGFTVNGKPIKGNLSGSAMDILGLALRVALLKSFIPHCPFMILDEPMSACDDFRTENMLAFITSVKFDQVILVTHEPISAHWANHNITL